jgi:hypothetical protein
VLLDISDSAAEQHRRLSADIFVADSLLSTQRLDEAVEAAKKRSLARPALTDEGNGASGRNDDAHIIERDYRTESM